MRPVAGEARLLVEVCADPPAALGVEQGDVTDNESGRQRHPGAATMLLTVSLSDHPGRSVLPTREAARLALACPR